LINLLTQTNSFLKTNEITPQELQSKLKQWDEVINYFNKYSDSKINEMLYINKLRPPFNKTNAWIPPDCVTRYIQESIKKECDEWLKVKAIYSKIIKFIISIRKVCNAIKIKRALKNLMNKRFKHKFNKYII
jgi:hypothetical protein